MPTTNTRRCPQVSGPTARQYTSPARRAGSAEFSNTRIPPRLAPQYRGTDESIDSDQASIPPLIENAFSTPWARRNAAARCERIPWWQYTTTPRPLSAVSCAKTSGNVPSGNHSFPAIRQMASSSRSRQSIRRGRCSAGKCTHSATAPGLISRVAAASGNAGSPPLTRRSPGFRAPRFQRISRTCGAASVCSRARPRNPANNRCASRSRPRSA